MCDKDLSVNCRNRSFDIVLYPGQSITLPLVTVGACGGISPSILVTSNTSGVEVIVSDNEILLDCTMKCASSKAKCIAKKGLHIACTAVSAIPVGINCNSLYIVKKDQKEMGKSQEFL